MMFELVASMVLTGALSVIVLFFILWIIHIFLNNAGVVDVGWGMGFIILSGIYSWMGQGFNFRNTLYFILVSLWGLRIVFFLLKRLVKEGYEDRRYQKIRKDWGGNMTLKFFFFFEFQALLEVILAVPFLIVSLNPSDNFTIMEFLGSFIFIGALLGETIADEQLQRFKSDARNKGKVCDVGLWRFSRHPNYFFEWLIWVGFFIFALGSSMGWLGIISPVIMYYLLNYVSGVPLAEEQSLQSRGDAYRQYQKRTSVFFPMPPKENI